MQLGASQGEGAGGKDTSSLDVTWTVQLEQPRQAAGAAAGPAGSAAVPVAVPAGAAAAAAAPAAASAAAGPPEGGAGGGEAEGESFPELRRELLDELRPAWFGKRSPSPLAEALLALQDEHTLQSPSHSLSWPSELGLILVRGALALELTGLLPQPGQLRAPSPARHGPPRSLGLDPPRGMHTAPDSAPGRGPAWAVPSQPAGQPPAG